MGRSKFEMNLPNLFGKKTIENFSLDEKFFEFSDYFLIDSYSVRLALEIEKKNGFWQLDVVINGSANTYCDRCGDPLLLDLKGKDTYFLKKEEQNSSQSHNVIYINHSSEPINLENMLKEVLFFVFPKSRIHKTNKCNLEVLSKLDVYQNNNKSFLSDHLKEKLK